MEDILDIYKRPYDSEYPVVCFDESSKQLVAEVIEPLPMEPEQPQRYDYQYECNGVSNLFMFFEPLAAWRHVEVTKQHTAVDYAHQMKYLVDIRYPDATKITIVHDQRSYPCSSLSIHRLLNRQKLNASLTNSSFATLPNMVAG